MTTAYEVITTSFIVMVGFNPKKVRLTSNWFYVNNEVIYCDLLFLFYKLNQCIQLNLQTKPNLQTCFCRPPSHFHIISQFIFQCD
jgi:hypothetical protein